MSKEKGSALIIVLITFSVLAILGVAIMGISVDRMTIAKSYEGFNGAVYSAQAGIEEIKLDIDKRIDDYSSYIISDVQAYIDENYGEEGFDPEGYSMERAKYYIFDEYLLGNTFQSTFAERDAGYEITFDEDDFDLEEGTITINCKGVYGEGNNSEEKDVVAKLQLSFEDSEFETEGISGGGSSYPLIIDKYDDESTTDNVSVHPDCEKFKFYGKLYSPKSISGFTWGSGDGMDFDVSDDVYIGGNLTIASKVDLELQKDFTVKGDLKISEQAVITIQQGDVIVEGKLEFDSESWLCALIINEGNLYVNGDILIKNKNNIHLLNGSIFCNGSIKMDLGDSWESSIDLDNGDLICKGDIFLGNVSEISINNGDIVCNGNITLDYWAAYIELDAGSIDCGGNLVLSANEGGKAILLKNGSININGQLLLYGWDSEIYLLAGSLKCKDDIIFRHSDCRIDIANGNLQCSDIQYNKSGDNTAEKCYIEIDTGDLLCSSITMKYFDEDIYLYNGDLKCNGNIKIDGWDSSININGNLYMDGTITGDALEVTGEIIEVFSEFDEITVNTAWCNAPVIEGPEISIDFPEFIDMLNLYKDGSNIIEDNNIDESVGTKENPVIIYRNGTGNLSINTDKNGDVIDIYGIVYAQGTVSIGGWGNNSKVNFHGMVISNKKLYISQGAVNATFEYDDDVLQTLSDNYPEIMSLLEIEGGGDGGGVGTESVGVVNGFNLSGWQE